MRREPTRVVLVLIGALGLAAAACPIVLATADSTTGVPPLQAVLLSWIVIGYVVSGLVAWWRRPESRLGPLMIAAGFVAFLSGLFLAKDPLLSTIGQAFDLVPAVLYLHVFLAFPSGRLDSRLERVLVGSGYFVAVGLQLVGMAMDGFGPGNLLVVVSYPEAALALLNGQLFILAGISLAGIGLLLSRRRGSRRRSGAALVDSFSIALAMIAVLFVAGALQQKGPILETIRITTFFLIGLAPIVFLVALLDARLARSAVGDLLVELRGDQAPADLREPLARALGDPSLALAYWLPEFGTWSDEEGRPVTLPGAGRGQTVINRDGQPVAMLIHDQSVENEPELLDAVSAAAEIALDNARLQAELKARLEELRGSRARVIEAEQVERKRLERNLHDGAQQRLIAISLELDQLARQPGTDSATKDRLEAAKREVATSLEEVRDVARGLHPAVLSGHGLAVALESLTAASPVPAELNVSVEGRLRESVEVAAFYVVSESLANVAKHARANTASIDVSRAADELVVEIVDDGVGGADTERGSGLRGLADRVEALGGRLRVWTPAGGGTRVRAEIPCG